MKYQEFKKLPHSERKRELKYELSKILVYTILVNLIGGFAVLIFGWKIGIFIGLVTLLIVLLIVRE